MVYNYFIDVVIFDVNFSNLQNWGIFITGLTFIIDIYMSCKTKPSTDDEEEDETIKEEKAI